MDIILARDQFPCLMLVDDSPSTLQFLESKLRERGYGVQAFLNGREALLAAAQEPPDLIMLDIHMPELSGYEICQKLKQSALLKDIPVLFLSSLQAAADKVKAFAVGGVDYVSKPYQLEEVEARVRTHLELRRLQKEAQRHNEHLEELVELRTRQLQDQAAELKRQNEALQREMAQRKRAEEQLRQAQKLEAIGLLAGGVAHDFNNILSAILMNCGLLQSHAQATPEVRGGLLDLEKEAKRAAALTRQLLLFSRRQILDARPLDLNEVIGNLAKMLQRLIGEHIDLQFQAKDPSLWVKADAGMMEQVVMNLCVNARDAMPRGGRLTILTQSVVIGPEAAESSPEARPGAFLSLSVMDTGCGMDETTQKRIFEPFFTTKDLGQGTGLGLSTVYGIIKQHQGWIEVESVLQKGSTFRIFLPALTENRAKSQNTGGALPLRGGNETILLVEDEFSVRQMLALHMRKWGYTVFEASNGLEAARLWEQHHAGIDLLFSDMVMPEGVTGLDLAERFRKQKNGLKVIISSGYSPERPRTHFVGEESVVWLTKPFEGHTLARTIRDCLDRS